MFFALFYNNKIEKQNFAMHSQIKNFALNCLIKHQFYLNFVMLLMTNI